MGPNSLTARDICTALRADEVARQLTALDLDPSVGSDLDVALRLDVFLDTEEVEELLSAWG